MLVDQQQWPITFKCYQTFVLPYNIFLNVLRKLIININKKHIVKVFHKKLRKKKTQFMIN